MGVEDADLGGYFSFFIFYFSFFIFLHLRFAMRFEI